MYHRVAIPDFDPWWLSVTPVNFEEQMRVIKKYGRPVQMQEMGEKLKHFTIGKKEIVVTFDDAYADNFKNAKPILERHDIPATFFVTTGAIDSNEEFWWDEIGGIILTAKIIPQMFEMSIAGTMYNWKIKQEELPKPLRYNPGSYHNNIELSRTQLYYALWEILLYLPFKEKKYILKQISSWASQSSTHRHDYLPMKSQELQALAGSSLFEIGAHTINHPILSHLPQEEQEYEITQSKHFLENMLNLPITSFSYPHGDYSSETLKIIEQLNFKNACTVVENPVLNNANPHLLPRFMVLNWTKEQFEQRLRSWLK